MHSGLILLLLSSTFRHAWCSGNMPRLPGNIEIRPWSSQDVKVPLADRPIGAIVGDNIQMIASVNPPALPTPTYTWWYENDGLTLVANGPNLNLSNVQESQSGRYVCVAENDKGQASKNVSIVVMKPYFKGMPLKTTTNVNVTNFELACEGVTRHVKGISWYFNGEIIGRLFDRLDWYSTERETLYDVEGQVVFVWEKLLFEGAKRFGKRQVERDDAGTYSCHVSLVETSEFSTELVVNTLPLVSVTPNKTEVNAGEFARIVCNVASTPPFQVQWIKEDGTVVSDDPVLELRSVSLSSAGRYYCQAFNTIDNVRQNSTASFDLVVLHAPYNVQVDPPKSNPVTHAVGDQITLTCSASGLPPPQYVWTKLDSTNVLSSESQLIIESAQKTDAGTYKCTVANKLGKDSDTSASIEVIEPSFVPLPKAKQVSFDEANLTLFCSVQERSGSEIIWLKDGVEIDSGDLYQIEVEDSGSPIHTLKSTLQFHGTKRAGESQIVPEDAGNYMCIFSSYPMYSSSMILTIDPVVIPTENVAMASSMSSAIAILVAFIVAACVLAAAVLIYFFVIRKKRHNKGLGPSYKTRPLNPEDLREQPKANV